MISKEVERNTNNLTSEEFHTFVRSMKAISGYDTSEGVHEFLKRNGYDVPIERVSAIVDNDKR